jgi:hypothetical protein
MSKIWHDEKFIKLTPQQQRLFFYILTCPHGNLSGIFVLKPGYAVEDLKCLPKDFKKDLSRLCEMNLVSYDFENAVILIHNFLKHNPITNPNQKKAVVSQLLALPNSPLLKIFIDNHKDLTEGLREVLLKPETESETVTGTEAGTEEKDIAPPGPSDTDGAPQKFFFSCPFFDIDFDYRIKLAKEFPALTDELLKEEFSKMEDWIIDNRSTKKFKSNGHLANPRLFIKNWLKKARVNGKSIFPSSEPKGFAGIREWERKYGGKPDA